MFETNYNTMSQLMLNDTLKMSLSIVFEKMVLVEENPCNWTLDFGTLQKTHRMESEIEDTGKTYKLLPIKAALPRKHGLQHFKKF